MRFPISLDKFKSLYCAALTPIPFHLEVSDSVSSGSFANVCKILMQRNDFELKKSVEHIGALEEKLQKLKVKQMEDEKLWKGLESKFSSTNTLSEQLTETLLQLAGLVQDAEKDRETLENKLSASSEALESLYKQMDGLSLKLDFAQEIIKTRDKELEKIKFAAEEKDTMIKNLEDMLSSSRLATEHAQNQYDELHNKFLILSLEKDGIHMINQELSNSLNDLRKVQESTVAQHTEDCRLAAERIQRLESEAEALISKKAEAEVTICKLEEKALESYRDFVKIEQLCYRNKGLLCCID